MKSDDFRKLCNEYLSLLEIREAYLLNWGFVNLEIPLYDIASEVIEDLPNDIVELWTAAQADGYDIHDVIRNLQDRRLIFPDQEGFFRTRFAETLRLTYLLRQRFSYNDWDIAPRLVSDMRIHLKRRQYPRRDIPVETLLAILEKHQLPAIYNDVIQLLLQAPNDKTFDVSGFQQRAINQQLRLLQKRRGENAIVIGAGTGAGKTKAFYVPALAYTAHTMHPQKHTVIVMAIYPRIELLKDQLVEALTECRKLRHFLIETGKRPITIGAYYGDTPQSVNSSWRLSEKWKQTRRKDGWICPYAKCPDCGEELIWRESDHEVGRARLHCSNPNCGGLVEENELLLTREQMIEHPPDILFTTTEMLNQRMSRVKEQNLFGIGASPPPRLMLLDEIHTYEDLNGAQVAYLLRRWRRACQYSKGRYPLCIVGLSATLSQAEYFFAKLTGIPIYDTYYISPDTSPEKDELEEEGMEYNIILKGDPASRTALLSTSIQTAMLLGRMLDPLTSEDKTISDSAFAPKVFIFGDKLDIVNRFYEDLDDAEWKKHLSRLRLISDNLEAPLKLALNQSGQNWRACTLIGNELDRALFIDRVTSQDRGVRADAKLIVATSTLEVGFNDPQVGAVIQHKTPYSVASFLQRKGRAGRQRQTRPWMILVTSAYGRDRWAFQHAETLFSPELPPSNLPIENYYIRKIQAVYTLMDWLGLELRTRHSQLDVWRLFSSQYGSSKREESHRQAAVQLLLEILNGYDAFRSFEMYLREALDLEDDEITIRSILWGEPRALMLDVIPTILNQLQSNWREVSLNRDLPAWRQIPRAQLSGKPIPTYIPPNLFSDLNLPEVTLYFSDASLDPESLSLTQTLSEFAPGNVSVRYAQAGARWLALPPQEKVQNHCVSLDQLEMTFDPVPYHVSLDNTDYAVYRPLTYTLDKVDEDSIAISSHGSLIWRSHFEPMANHNGEQGHILELDPNSHWRKLIKSIEAFLQTNHASISITRLGVGVEINTQYTDGHNWRDKLIFVGNEGKGSSAVGFNMRADGIKIELEPCPLEEIYAAPEWNTSIYRTLTPYYFLHRLKSDQRIVAKRLTIFEIEWLWQIEMSMLIAVAVTERCTLPEALIYVTQHRPQLVKRTLNAIFQSQSFSVDNDDIYQGKLYDHLLELQREEEVVDALEEHVDALWCRPDVDFNNYVRECYTASMATVLYDAITNLVSDIASEDLLLDVADNTVWITEKVAGGVGLIAKIVEAIALQPREFELQLMDTLRYCEREQLSINLRAVAALLEQGNLDLKTSFEHVRQRRDLSSLRQTKQMLTETLEKNGIPATRKLIVAMNAKYLRPNSSPDSDNLIVDVLNFWNEQEERLNCQIDLRVLAVAATRDKAIHDQLDVFLRYIGGEKHAQTVDENQMFNLVQSLLWMSCTDSCPSCIETYQPYQSLVHPSRKLVLALLQERHVLDFGSDDWLAQAYQTLSQHAEVEIVCPDQELHQCKPYLTKLLVTQIDTGYQLFFPAIESIQREEHQWRIRLVLRELIGQ